MRSIAVALVVMLVQAASAAAQTAQTEPPRGTLGATLMHAFGLPMGGLDGTFRIGPIDLQGSYVRRSEREGHEDDPDWVRTFEWFKGGVVWPFLGNERIRLHTLGGFELLIDSTNTCALIRARGGDCEEFPHRRPGIHGGLGVEFVGGSRFFTRVQYLTSAVFVYEQVGVGHRFQVAAGFTF